MMKPEVRSLSGGEFFAIINNSECFYMYVRIREIADFLSYFLI